MIYSNVSDLKGVNIVMAKILGGFKGFLNKEPEKQQKTIVNSQSLRDKAISDKISEMQYFKGDYKNVYQPKSKGCENQVEALNELLEKPSGCVGFMEESEREAYAAAAIENEQIQRICAECLTDGTDTWVVDLQFPDETVGSGAKTKDVDGGNWKPVEDEMYDTDTVRMVFQRDTSAAGFKIVSVEPNLNVETAQPNGVKVKEIASQCTATYGELQSDGSIKDNSPGYGALMKARVSGMNTGLSYDSGTDAVYMTQVDRTPQGSRVAYMVTSASPLHDDSYYNTGVRVLKNDANYGKMIPVGETVEPYVGCDKIETLRDAGYGQLADDTERLDSCIQAARSEFSVAKAHGAADFHKPTDKQVADMMKNDKNVREMMMKYGGDAPNSVPDYDVTAQM